MGLGGISALAGMAKPVDRVSADEREFRMMNELQAQKEKEDQQSLAAQELESKQYAEISEKASQLLEPDRNKIRSASLELQKKIRSKIEEYGSRKAFFAAGGASLLAQYKNDLLTSEETTSYFDNKKNMEALIRLKESGKGHLISSIDLQNMQAYEQGIGTKITYSGMKSEIPIPEEYFDYGVNIPAENILHYKDNYMAIYGNWLIENPDKTELTGKDLEEQLLAYTMRNHSGRGLNEFNRKAEAAARAVKAEKDAVTRAGTGEQEDDIPDSWVASANEVFTNAKARGAITINNLMNPVNYSKELAMKDKNFSEVIGSITPYDAAVSNFTSGNFIDKLAKKGSRALGIDNKYRIAGAFVVPGNKTALAKSIYQNEKGVSEINLNLNSAEFYSPNGEKLTDEFVKEAIEEGNNVATFQTLVYGYTDANGKLITQKLDSNGKPLRKSQRDPLTETEKDHRTKFIGDPTMEMFSVLTTKDGETIYHKIPSSSYRDETELALIIGKADDTTNARKRRIKTNQEVAKQEAVKSVVNKNVSMIVAEASAPSRIFSSPDFMNEAASARSANGANRNELLKAYYMAISHFKNGGIPGPEDLELEPSFQYGNSDNFLTIVNSSKELKNGLINHSKVKDESFIDNFVRVHSGDSKEDLEHNAQFKKIWMDYLTALKRK